MITFSMMNRERFKASSHPRSPVLGTRRSRRPHVLRKARREVAGCNARDNGASPTVTCPNPVLVILTRMSSWTYESVFHVA